MRTLSGFIIFLLLTPVLPAQDAKQPTFRQVEQRAMANTKSAPAYAAAEPARVRERRMSPRIWTMIGVAAAGTAAGIWAANRGNRSSGSAAFNVSAGTPVVTGPR